MVARLTFTFSVSASIFDSVFPVGSLSKEVNECLLYASKDFKGHPLLEVSMQMSQCA